ncbi:uncharacterized protein LOC107465466 [Arachis duranensis]|uniref:Uncharacterized protein LOC107465466 n=1 Tax=Arachis duranensis TaxID=130453 RepID=A0A6P4BCA5_ARADU|nr:uncharacterized protein LOC107465466 [Arachis duranensis]
MPYPQKLRQAENDKQFAQFAYYFKTLEIKIPFVKALEQIPSIAKFMKEILSYKKDWREVKTVILTEEYSAVINRNLLEKHQDPGSFMIPCTLRGAYTKTTLCDLRASIILMPSSLVKKLGLIQDVKPTRIFLQLANGFVKIPSGVVEDMIVRVGPFAFSTDFVPQEEEALIQVLKTHKTAIGWTISDLKGISLTKCMHKIRLEDDAKLVVQPQRRLNLAIKEVVQKEVTKLWEAAIIYPTSDSPWVSPIYVVPKKGGMTMIHNEKNKLIPTRTVTGWRYNQIAVDPQDQEKTAFTCPYGIVFGHQISNKGIEVDQAKMEVIERFPPPTNVKAIISFLGHAGFYRRFIKDFSKIAKPLCNLLAMDTPFVFDRDCLHAFETLKAKLISAPIISAPN